MAQITLLAIACVIGIAVAYVPSLRRRVAAFFAAKSHPVNLAIFRIAFFWRFYEKVDPDLTEVYSSFPDELRVPIAGLGPLNTLLPLSTELATVSCFLLQVACVFAAVGFFSRASALVATVVGFYVLGVPQLFGKVNHVHYYVWFAAILAASRSGDALSVDAILSRWRHPERFPLRESTIYGLPIRVVWLLIGIIYFFPGFWKLWSGGLEWAFSENLKWMLWRKWIDGLGWPPPFRIDNYPLLYQGAAAAVIVFELAFVFLLFFPRLRLIAVAGGLVFHHMTRVLMAIYFKTLVYCYVVFIDWYGIYSWLRRRLSRRQEPAFAEDSHSPPCSRLLVMVASFFVFGNMLFGALHLARAWPLACFPTFSALASPSRTSLRVKLDFGSGETELLANRQFGQHLPIERFTVQVRYILTRPDAMERDRLLEALWSVLRERDPRYFRASRIEFYEVVETTSPERWEENPLSEKLIMEVESPPPP